jgi:hypothetical protein
MHTTILSLLGLALSASISAAPAQRGQRPPPSTKCTKDTYLDTCVVEADANLLDIPVKAAVKGVCRSVLSTDILPKIVSGLCRLVWLFG